MDGRQAAVDTLHKNKEASARQAELLAKEKEKVEVKGYLERFASVWGRNKRPKDGKDGSGDVKEVRFDCRRGCHPSGLTLCCRMTWWWARSLRV